MNKLLTTLAAVVFAASAGIASAQAPGKGEMKAAPGSPAAAQSAPAPSAAPGDTKGSPSAMDSGAPKAKKSKANKTKKAKKGKSKKAKSEDASTAAPK